KVQAALGVVGESIGFSGGTVEKLNSTLRASKVIALPKPQPGSTPAATERPWFADLRTAMEFGLAGIRYRDYVTDSTQGSRNGSDDILGLDRLTVRRNKNELNIQGRYKLPAEVGKAPSQPAELDVALNAPETGDFWRSDSPNKLSGPLQLTAQIEWRQQT